MDQSEFDVNRWLDVAEDDGDVVREIAATRPEEDPLPSKYFHLSKDNKHILNIY